MTFSQASYSVDDDPAVKIVDAASGHVNKPVSAIIFNAGANEVYLGGADVADTDGIVLAANGLLSVSGLTVGDDLYAICASGETATVEVTQT